MKNLLKLNGAKILRKEAQQSINGGSDCRCIKVLCHFQGGYCDGCRCKFN